MTDHADETPQKTEDEPVDADFTEASGSGGHPEESPYAPDVDPDATLDPDATPVDRLAWGLCQEQARDELEIRQGRRMSESSYVTKWPGEAIFDLEPRMRARLPEGVYTVVVRDDGARVVTSAKITVLGSLEPDDVLEPEPTPQPAAAPVTTEARSVERLATDIQREALEHLRRAAAAGTPEAYERVRRDAYDEGYDRGQSDARDPDAVTGWSALVRGIEALESVGKAFVLGDTDHLASLFGTDDKDGDS